MQKCLDSIPVRDDLQVIIVDDNSDCIDSAAFPGINRLNTEVYFDKSGKGAGKARNIGLSHACGEWVIFADSDDIFEPGFNEILNLLKKDNTSDLVNFDVTSRNFSDGKPNKEIEKINYHCNKPQFIENPSSFKYIVLTPWGKAIRRKLILDHNIQFEEVKFGNDLLFATLCDFYCSHRRVIPLIGYCWMYRENSLWRQENLDWAVVRFKVLMNAGLVMRKLGEKDVANRYLNGAYSFLGRIRKYSQGFFVECLFQYAIKKPDVKVLFWKLPKGVARYIIDNLKY